MIDTTELRIGNWISPLVEYANPTRVKEVKEEGVMVPVIASMGRAGEGRDTERKSRFVDAVDIYGVVLTEKILMDSFFAKGEVHIQSRGGMVPCFTKRIAIVLLDGLFYHWYGIEDLSWTQFPWKEIRYVHELQNVYRALTGQELDLMIEGISIK